jgi:hypothetical protein
MNQEIRNRLRNVVTQCRKLLEDSVSQELEGKYGIFSRRDKVNADSTALMAHLSEEEKGARKDILDHLGHIQARGFNPKDALDQLVREIAFTHLNRLCAYKMMEAREVYVGGQKFREAVSRGVNSNGVKFYLAEHPEEERLFNTGHQDLAYRHFLDWLGGLLSDEIGVLFNPNDPANRLYPRQKTLDDVLELLNYGGIKPSEIEMREEWPHIWSQDETIGWVYQYFTPKELRDQARKDSPAPRNSYELAFRNQFFTPRYVVEFLTDNTLGRIWYEMQKGETSVSLRCRYLVRRSHSVFLSPQGQPPKPFAYKESIGAIETKVMWICPPEIDKNLDAIWLYAQTVDGYDYAKERLGLECGDLANQRLEEYKRTKKWDGSFEELRCCLFFEQRRWRHYSSDPEEDDLVAIFKLFKAICDRWNAETEFIPNRAKKDPRELKVLDPACGSGHFLLYCFDLLLTIYEEAYTDSELGPSLQAEYPTIYTLRRDAPRLILAHNLHGIDIDMRASQIAALALWLRCQKAYRDLGLKKDRPIINRSNFVCAEPMPHGDQLFKDFVDQLEPRFLGQVVEVVFEKMKLAGEAGSLLKIEDEIRDAVTEAKQQWLRETTKATDRKGQTLLFTQDAMDRLAGKPEQPSLFDLSDITDGQFFERAEFRVIEAMREYSDKAQSSQKLKRQLFTDDAEQGFAFVDLCQKRYDVVVMNPPFGETSVNLESHLAADYPDWNKNLLCAFIDRAYQLSLPAGMVGVIFDRTAIVKSTYADFRRGNLLADSRLRYLADLGWGVLDANVEVTTAVISHQPSEYSLFLDARETASDMKGEWIAARVDSFSKKDVSNCIVADTRTFKSLPNAVIGYDFPDFLRIAFLRYKSLSESGYKAYQGHALKSEKHFRVWWEMPERKRFGFSTRMFNGAGFAPYYSPLYECVVAPLPLDELPKDSATVLRNKSLQGSAGVCFGKRGEYFCSHVLPRGHIFTVEGQVMPVSDFNECLEILGYMNTPVVRLSLNRYCGQHKYSGYVNLLPYPKLPNAQLVRAVVRNAIELQMIAGSFDETQSHFSVLSRKDSLSECAEEIKKALSAGQTAVITAQDTCNGIVEKCLDLSEPEMQDIESFRSRQPTPAFGIEGVSSLSEVEHFSAHSIVSQAVGVVFGRWDVRLAVNETSTAVLPDPFAPLPDCPPAMLRDDDGAPLNVTPLKYPIDIQWHGVLVDDEGHQDDIVLNARHVLESIWNAEAEVIEKNVCAVLRVEDFRGYMRRGGKGGFWDDHLSRYSKSRRKAPIYWLLQSSKRNYAIWLYYQRIDKDLLFKILVNYVEPKIRMETSRLETMQRQKVTTDVSTKEGKRLAAEMESQEDLISELQDFEDKLRRAADLHLVPDLNDGVVLNVAPLWELVPWKEAKNCWEELLEGKYEWSSISKQLCQKGLVK